MSRPCSVCQHPNRKAIDEALVGGQPIRAIAGRYHAGRDSVARHLRSHVSPALVKVAARREEREATTLLGRMERLIQRTERLLEAAEASGAVGQALAAIDRLWKGYELVGKITGEIKPDGQVLVVNLQQSPEWVELRGRLLVALLPFPDARARVSAALTGQVIDAEAG